MIAIERVVNAMKQEKMIYDVIIIGGGAAGLIAALLTARYNLKTLIIAKEFGGTGNIAHKVNGGLENQVYLVWTLWTNCISRRFLWCRKS